MVGEVFSERQIVEIDLLNAGAFRFPQFNLQDVRRHNQGVG
jgi:hypothetical protein